MLKGLVCQAHKLEDVFPQMICTGNTPLGTRQFVCAVCGGIREQGDGEILSLHEGYGFIKGGLKNFFFHFSDLDYFQPKIGDHVSFDISFLGNGKIKVVNLKPNGEQAYED